MLREYLRTAVNVSGQTDRSGSGVKCLKSKRILSRPEMERTLTGVVRNQFNRKTEYIYRTGFEYNIFTGDS